MPEYIEKEAIKAAVRKRLSNSLIIGWLIRIINEIPAADVAPVVRGEWIVCGDGDNVPWMCSNCGKTTAHKYKTMYGKFCPNCVARMDGDGE